MSINTSIGYSEQEILARVYLADIISQSSTIEALLNDALAKNHLEQDGRPYSEQEYLGYIERKLLNRSLANKCDSFILLFAAHASLDQNNLNMISGLFAKWRKLRNRVAHGHIVNNSSGTPILYHGGTCYSICKMMERFLTLNAELIELISRPDLYSPYRDKYVLRDPENTPDNPK